MGTTEKRVRRSRAQWQAVIDACRAQPAGGVGVLPGRGDRHGELLQLAPRLAADAPGTEAVRAGEAARSTDAPAFLDLGALAGATTTTGSAWDIELELGAGVVLRLRRA